MTVGGTLFKAIFSGGNICTFDETNMREEFSKLGFWGRVFDRKRLRKKERSVKVLRLFLARKLLKIAKLVIKLVVSHFINLVLVKLRNCKCQSLLREDFLFPAGELVFLR